MHLRRALLLFAIVLGLAAIAASISRPPEESNDRAERPAAPSAELGLEAETEPADELHFDAERERTRRLMTGEAATLLVEVDEPGQVEIPDLGLSGFADPLTPARFEVLINDPGRHEIMFTPVAGDESSVAGELAVETAGD